MVLKFYAFNLSPPSQYVATVLHEKKVPFEFVNIDLLKGEQKTPEVLAKQPFGQVPYIVGSYTSMLMYTYLINLSGRRWPRFV